MRKKEFVMLADEYDPRKFDICGAMVSEKYDGVRCIWIPQTKGLMSNVVPFMNSEKDSKVYICSGLWTRGRKPIMCPPSFTADFPRDHCLDGELYMGRGKFQQTLSAVRKHDPLAREWKNILYMIFDIPSYSELQSSSWLTNNDHGLFKQPINPTWLSPKRFDIRYNTMISRLVSFFPQHVLIAPQTQLDYERETAEKELEVFYNAIVELGAEGVMLRRPMSYWKAERSEALVKFKPESDMEGTVVGWTKGKGKLEGMMGALIVKLPDNQTFELSGFTENERRLAKGKVARLQPAEFANGDVVTFKYCGKTDAGIPKFARYFRRAIGV